MTYYEQALDVKKAEEFISNQAMWIVFSRCYKQKLKLEEFLGAGFRR